MALLFVTLGFGLTGYLLPWDQKGYWATKVATNIMGGAPVVGPYLQKIVVGGGDYGNQTLTRFYGLHVGLLPGLFVLCLAAHVALFRRHGLTPPATPSDKATGTFWPEQLFMDSVASVVVFGTIVALVLSEGGANLDAPAEPSSSEYPARPEWYFLALFQLLKYFPGKQEMIGTIVIPTAILVVMLLIPLFDRVLPRGLAHFLACGVVFALVGGAGYLTYEAVKTDANDHHFQDRAHKADDARQRALRAGRPRGFPPMGRCTSCSATRSPTAVPCSRASAWAAITMTARGRASRRLPTSKDFGSSAWIRGLLEDPQVRHLLRQGPAVRRHGRVEEEYEAHEARNCDDVADFVASFAAIPAEDQTPERMAQ